MSHIKNKLSKLKTTEDAMKYDDENAEGPIMTKRYWKAIQKKKKEKNATGN